MREPKILLVSVGIIGLFLLSIVSPVGATYDESSVLGTVYNLGGEPRENALITIYNLRTEEMISTGVDEYGQFELDLDHLPSGFQIGDEIALEAFDGDVNFWSSLYDISHFNNFLVVYDVDGQDRMHNPTDNFAYWGSPSYEMGEGEYSEEQGAWWNNRHWDDETGIETVIPPPLVIRDLMGEWPATIDMRYEDDRIEDATVDSYKVEFIFWASTIPPPRWGPSPKNAQPPNLVRTDTDSYEYDWNQIPFDTWWHTMSVDLDPPKGFTTWYGNAEMIQYHWNDQTHDWDFYQHAVFWDDNPAWQTFRGINE